ncbi:MAG: hypothetical protein K1X53_12305 [Candidatus Sumerlaeaceae bacterium]|nr:hypothetical protein [Candidatus Sumerlaeaceae bacterium]
MSFVKLARVGLVSAALASVVMLLPSGAGAFKRSGREMNLQELTQFSDLVVIGQVADKRVSAHGAFITTDYDIDVQDVLKDSSKSVQKKLTVTLPGGDLTNPPISQHSEMVPHMYKGESVALFLNTAPQPNPNPALAQKANVQDSPLAKSPRIAGLYEGKFTIITDKLDGRQKITRFNITEFGYVYNDRTVKRLMDAVANHDLNVTSGPAVALPNGAVTSPEGKSIVDAAIAAAGGAKTVKKLPMKPGDTVSIAAGNGTIPAVQDLEDFKSQVRKFVNQK